MNMNRLTDQMRLVLNVTQCIKDAEGTVEAIRERIPRLRMTSKKRQAERSLEFFEAVVYHLKRLQRLENGKDTES